MSENFDNDLSYTKSESGLSQILNAILYLVNYTLFLSAFTYILMFVTLHYNSHHIIMSSKEDDSYIQHLLNKHITGVSRGTSISSCLIQSPDKLIYSWNANSC